MKERRRKGGAATEARQILAKSRRLLLVVVVFVVGGTVLQSHNSRDATSDTREEGQVDNSSTDDFVVSSRSTSSGCIVCRRRWKSARWKGGYSEKRRWKVENWEGGDHAESLQAISIVGRRSVSSAADIIGAAARRITRTITRTKKWHQAEEDNVREEDSGKILEVVEH